MGNTNLHYNQIEEEYKEEKPLPVIQPEHKKGRTFAKLLNMRLNKKYTADYIYWDIFDLRNGKQTWRIYIKLLGNELEFYFGVLYKQLTHHECYLLRYSSSSTQSMLILKGQLKDYDVTLELYADNIHCQRLLNLEISKELKIYGFITYNNQDKIPIAF
jgi:hypothetical protein